MSVNGIHGTTPPVHVPSPSSDGAGTSAARSRLQGTAEQTATPTDAAESKPTPLRFPWLSRLSAELAAASKTPTTFSAPVLGDNIDKQA